MTSIVVVQIVIVVMVVVVVVIIVVIVVVVEATVITDMVLSVMTFYDNSGAVCLGKFGSQDLADFGSRPGGSLDHKIPS